ncbi:hypothetical protein AB0J52_06735 [Spirillospora sp. NPDC049652]
MADHGGTPLAHRTVLTVRRVSSAWLQTKFGPVGLTSGPQRSTTHRC